MSLNKSSATGYKERVLRCLTFVVGAAKEQRFRQTDTTTFVTLVADVTRRWDVRVRRDPSLPYQYDQLFAKLEADADTEPPPSTSHLVRLSVQRRPQLL